MVVFYLWRFFRFAPACMPPPPPEPPSPPEPLLLPVYVRVDPSSRPYVLFGTRKTRDEQRRHHLRHHIMGMLDLKAAGNGRASNTYFGGGGGGGAAGGRGNKLQQQQQRWVRALR